MHATLAPDLLRIRSLHRCLTVAVVIGVVLAAPATAQSGVTLAVVPEVEMAAPGDTITVDLAVTATGDAFNAYDTTVVFDPSRLRLLPLDPTTAQEGPLMADACPERFHVFSVAADQASATINHGLLCAGVAVAGPGTIYRLRFECQEVVGETEIGLLPGTSFYDAGAFVTPVALIGAMILIDASVSIESGEDEAAADLLPEAVALVQNMPNPFNPSTTIRFATADPGHVSLEVFDLRGQRVGVLVDGPRPAGRHAVVFDGHGLASGTYVYRLATDRRVIARTMQLVK